MKKLLLLAFILLVALTLQAQAQHIFLRMYWVVGDVSDPDGVGTEGRWVVFYPGDTSIAYSDDNCGTVGLSGRANQDMINAFEDWRMVLTPGIYKCATVKGYKNGVLVDDYGANPVDVTITGSGYDVHPTLVLVKGGGIAPPGPRPLPPWLAALMPHLSNIKFGERKWQPTLVAQGEKFIISERPKISATATSPVPLLVDSLSMALNEGTSAAKNYRIQASHYTGTRGLAPAYSEINFLYDFTKESVDPIPESKDAQTVTIKAANEYGTTVEVCTVYIMAGDPEIIGTPICFPSPVRLRTDRRVTFQYGLSKDANVDIFVFDISARVVKKFTFNAGSPGGQAGGTANPNKVEWDLITDQGSLIGSGIYLFNIVDRTRNKVIGKGKLAAAP